MDLDELGVTLAEDILSVIEKHTLVALADHDDDVMLKTNELVEAILEAYMTHQEEEEESDTELRGDMDTFPG